MPTDEESPVAEVRAEMVANAWKAGASDADQVADGAGFDWQVVDVNGIAVRLGAAYRHRPSGMNGSGGDAGLADVLPWPARPPARALRVRVAGLLQFRPRRARGDLAAARRQPQTGSGAAYRLRAHERPTAQQRSCRAGSVVAALGAGAEHRDARPGVATCPVSPRPHPVRSPAAGLRGLGLCLDDGTP